MTSPEAQLPVPPVCRVPDREIPRAHGTYEVFWDFGSSYTNVPAADVRPRRRVMPGDMAKRIVLLRAVNVGEAKLPVAVLREIAEGLGASAVSTYIASGNLLADIPGAPRAFDAALEKEIEKRFGFYREEVSRDSARGASTLSARMHSSSRCGWSRR